MGAGRRSSPAGWPTGPGRWGLLPPRSRSPRPRRRLHRLETVYRRLNERLATADTPQGALRNIIDGWIFTLEEDVLAEGSVDPDDASQLLKSSNELLEHRLADVARTAPTFSAALRGYRQAQVDERPDIAEGILAWLAGQPNVASEAKRFAGVKGDIDHFGALNFLQGLLTILRDSGHVGMLPRPG